jgi:phosphate transport system substrate-binding protein
MKFVPGLVAILTLAIVGACDRSEAPVTSTATDTAAPVTVEASTNDAGMVEWLTLPAARVAKADEAEEERRRTLGRDEPEPEFLQPRIDTTLPDYVPRTDIKINGKFEGTSSDIMPRLVERWVAEFQVYYPDAEFNLNPPFAGSKGMLKVIDGDLDFVFVSRELKPTDITSFNEKYGYEPFNVAISGGVYRHFGFLDAIGVIVNKDNPIEKISLDELDGLLSTSRHRGANPIRTWGELGLTGDWADKPVNVYAITPWNGFEEFVRQKVLSVGDKRGEWREDLNFKKLAFDPAPFVSKDKYSIGYTGLAYLDSGVKVLPLAEHKGGDYIDPSYENVAKFDYPLSRTMFFAANRKSGESLDPTMEEFLKFILSRQGQQIVLDHEVFLPLRAPQVAESRAHLAE